MWPRNDFYRIREGCQAAEDKYGLSVRTAPGDRTAHTRASRAESEKAARQGSREPARVTLRRYASGKASPSPDRRSRRRRRVGCAGIAPVAGGDAGPAVTQAWALERFDSGAFAGVRWWSYYNPDWGSLGLWDISPLTVTDVAVLTPDHPAYTAAAGAIIRIIE